MSLIRCPNCGKVLTEYVSGTGEFRQLCGRCKEMIHIYSAGKTSICEERLTTVQIDIMMRTNKCPQF